MKPYIPVLIALVASAPAAAQTYKWVDERGVVTYGTKPPAGKPAQRVDIERQNTIATDDAQLKREAEAKRRADLKLAPPPPPPSAPTAARARGMDFETFIRLQRGMSEGELMQRAGRPDYVALENVQDDIVKAFYWYPTTSDPFTTVVTVRGGRIDTIQRTKKF
jgi:hypothetical protein